MGLENSNTQGAKGYNAVWQRNVIRLLTTIANVGATGPLATAAKGATVAGNPTSRSKSADVTALDVQLVDASGNPIVSFGPTAVARTPALTRAVIAGTVAAGAQAVSAYNAGDPLGVSSTNATWLGAALKPGEQVSYSVIGPTDTLGAFAYTGTATAELVITVLT